VSLDYYSHAYAPVPPPRPRRKWPIVVASIVTVLAVAGLTVTITLLAVRDDDNDTNSAAPATTASSVQPTTSITPFDESPFEDEPTEPTGLEIGQAGSVVYEDPDTGTSIDAGDVTVTKVDKTSAAADEYSDPPEHGQFWIITVKVKATGEEVFDINPFDFYIRDKKGNHFAYGDGADYFLDKGDLNAVDVYPGERTQGKVVIDAPKNATDIVYAPGDEALYYWKLST
jgi:hypothetical protein